MPVSGFPATFRFRHRWRPYQDRVLAEFDRHLADRHFHVAAAPGAGKTVLGLEVLRRLGAPALVLAPTTAIRDQWLQRLCDSFLGHHEAPGWVSTSLEQPALLTLATYQGLHAAVRRIGMPALLDGLVCVGLATLVLDEAHHLRQQWWQSLLQLKLGLASPWVVALTATPPFDVPQPEWNRYIELCGPLDAEVSVPELVKAGNLCPHQDYLYFSAPTDDEHGALERFDRDVRSLLNTLMLEPELIERLATHPLTLAPAQHVDLLTRHGDLALALALFLHETAPERARALLHQLGLADHRLPPLHLDWAELLFNGLLFGRDPLLPEDEPVLQGLTRRLRQIGAVSRRQVYLRAPPRLQQLLEGSRGKLASVEAIIELEARADPVGLRAVVLCDQIREFDIAEPGDGGTAMPQLGVLPVFDRLRRLQLPHVRLAVLTGSVVVVPAAAVPDLRAELALVDSLIAEPLWHAPGFQRITVAERDAGALLGGINRLFEHGGVNVIIGTGALLGEGWDAPALSTLVLATAVRTSMRSNQMRGRAIRVHPARPDKAANIWHLACLRACAADVDSPAPAAGADLERLAQRFRSFAGIGLEPARIETGIERLALDAGHLRDADCAALNARMVQLALDRHAMREAWRQVLHAPGDREARMVVETRVPLRRLRAAVQFGHGLLWQRIAWLRWLHAQWLLRRLRRIAYALLDALRAAGQIHSNEAWVEFGLGERQVSCRLRDATMSEESLFGDSLRELFELPQAPRYLLEQGRSLFAVPGCLGGNRALADCLLSAFEQNVGRSRLIHVRGEAGKRALLRARERWIAGRFDQGVDARLRWR